MPTPEQITGKILFFAELYMGSKIYRFCTDPTVELTDNDGRTYLFDLAFDFPEWQEEALPFMDGLPNKTVGISLQMGAEINYLISLGVEVSAGYMRLYKGYESNLDMGSLIPIFTGRVDDWMILYDGTFAFNLYNDEISRKTFQPTNRTVSADNFPDFSILDSANGAPYPILIGSPCYGITTIYGGYQTGGVAINVNYEAAMDSADLRYIIAGHKINAGSVFVRASSASEILTDTYLVAEDTDSNGVTYTYIDFSTLDDGAFLTVKDNTAVYIAFPEDNSGMIGINGVGDFVVTFFQDIGKRFNWDRIFEIRDQLNQYRIDTQIMDNPQIWDWTFQNVLSYLPISYLEDGDGLYFLLWDFEREPSQTLLVERDLFRVDDSGISCSSFGDICNDITIYAGLNPISGNYGIKAQASYDKSKDYADPRLIFSEGLAGPRQLEINLDHISDSKTIDLILQATVRRYGLQYRTLQYLADIWLDYLEIGDVVTISDPEMGLEEKAFLTGKLSKCDSLQLKFIIFS